MIQEKNSCLHNNSKADGLRDYRGPSAVLALLVRLFPGCHPMSGSKTKCGFTLLEIVVVLAILVVLAGLVIPHLNNLQFGNAGKERSTEKIITSTTLAAVRDAILGTSGQSGLWQDLGQRTDRFPLSIADLYRPSTNLPPALRTFDPVNRLGWRGDYLLPGKTAYTVNVSEGFTSDYGANGDPGVSDAWGRPIILQVPKVVGVTFEDELLNARLISAGPDGVINTPIAKLTPNDLDEQDRGDDIILFLRVADPT
jgi:prepilin-type N-terminal cleavage/methylation domain-containing protein